MYDTPENFSYDEMQTFSPEQGLYNETAEEKAKRGSWNMAEGGERVNFSIIMRNRTNNNLRLELFNAERSVSKVNNDDLYSQNPLIRRYKPHSEFRTLYELAVTTVAGGLTTISVDPTAFFDDAGNLLFTSDRTYANFKSTYENIVANGLDAAGTLDVNIQDAYISCGELPYVSLLDDIAQGLVLQVDQMRIQVTNVVTFQGVLNLKRWQSFGGAQSNPLPFAIGRDPKNNLLDTIDITKVFLIDKKTAIEFNMPGASQMNITFFCTAYRANGVKW